MKTKLVPGQFSFSEIDMSPRLSEFVKCIQYKINSYYNYWYECSFYYFEILEKKLSEK